MNINIIHHVDVIVNRVKHILFKKFNEALDFCSALLYNAVNSQMKGVISMTLGEYIKQYRAEHDLSQRQFASLCGISNGYVSMLEKGMNTSTGQPIIPTIQTMRQIANAMGLTIHKVLSEVDDIVLDIGADPNEDDKQPPVVEGLSEEALMIARIVDRLPPEHRRLLLAQVRALESAIPDPASAPQSPEYP
ncbi:MAG: helix-turn-helix domain-containing protein [Bacteroidales bacterium]|nr:helix-turn-helix domain-containing protein [Bacteroidales bacterium]